MNVSTSIPPSLTPPTRWRLAARSSSSHLSRARALASKRMASASFPSTSPNSKKRNPASLAPVFFSKLQFQPALEAAQSVLGEICRKVRVAHPRHFSHPFRTFPFTSFPPPHTFSLL